MDSDTLHIAALPGATCEKDAARIKGDLVPEGIRPEFTARNDYSGINVPLVAVCNVPPVAQCNVPPQKWLQ